MGKGRECFQIGGSGGGGGGWLRLILLNVRML